MQISLTITNYNRFGLLFKSFEKVLHDDRISEIIISDDCSDYDLYKKIVSEAAKHSDKIKVSRTDTNMGCYRNKRRVISLAETEWVVILDSDNTIDRTYLDAIWAQEPWDSKTIYAPELAAPHFDYKHLGGKTISRENVSKYAGHLRNGKWIPGSPRFDCF